MMTHLDFKERALVVGVHDHVDDGVAERREVHVAVVAWAQRHPTVLLFGVKPMIIYMP